MRWLAEVPQTAVFLSTTTIAELQRGVLRLRFADPAKANRLEAWIDALVATHQWLPFDVEAARKRARILPKRADPKWKTL
jgi:predicted nucleic acid-binding protein